MRRQLGRAEQRRLCPRRHRNDDEGHSGVMKSVRHIADSDIKVREAPLPNAGERLAKIISFITIQQVCTDIGFSVLKNEMLSYEQGTALNYQVFKAIQRTYSGLNRIRDAASVGPAGSEIHSAVTVGSGRTGRPDREQHRGLMPALPEHDGRYRRGLIPAHLDFACLCGDHTGGRGRRLHEKKKRRRMRREAPGSSKNPRWQCEWSQAALDHKNLHCDNRTRYSGRLSMAPPEFCLERRN